jgi:D-glycero-alpha-D-manno-heptose 1-phosphate guanylyltransferase
MMEAVILAGGLGTRLRSVVPDLPKPMAPIAGRPFLELLLGVLEAKGFERVVLSLGYKSELVTEYFGDHFRGIDLAYAIEARPLGTGGALRLALSRCQGRHAYVFNGDTYLALDVARVEAAWQQQHAPIIVARQVDDTARYGRLTVADGRVAGLESGVAGPGLINAGCYVLPIDIIARQPALERFSFETDYLVSAVHGSRFDVFVSDGQFIDIGIPDDYARAQTELQYVGL